jgi:hypothetical protein
VSFLDPAQQLESLGSAAAITERLRLSPRLTCIATTNHVAMAMQ